MAFKFVTLTINGRQVNVAFDENSIHVFNAFPIKDDLKMRGYRWNPQQKSWFINPPDVEREIENLRNGLSPEVALPEPPAPQPSAPETGTFPKSFSVSELRNHIERLLRSQLSGEIWVRGVVASEVKYYAWGSYFDLSDEDDRNNLHFSVEARRQPLLAVEEKLRRLGVAERLEKDLPVFFLVQVGLSAKYTVNVRLMLVDILPEYTQSRIRNQRDITLDRLKEEGILDNQKKLRLPLLLDHIGIVTSAQGTSVQDILAALHPFEKAYHFYFIDSRMEGARAVESVMSALDYLERWNGAPLDAIIIARGGGSEQSLAVFNDYRLCRRICLARVPVVTAIGHEKDLSAAELCSHLTPTPSTPSGVGKFLHDRWLTLRNQLSTVVSTLISHVSRVREAEMARLKGYTRNITSMARQTLKFREREFVDTVRWFDQSATFLVRDQERGVAEKIREITRRNRRELALQKRRLLDLSGGLLSSGRMAARRRETDLAKTATRLDFAKRWRENRLQRAELAQQAARLLDTARKKMRDEERGLEGQLRLSQASSPEVILKKGFTMTLDGDGRVITTDVAFRKAGRARLKFYDGVSPIVREEES